MNGRGPGLTPVQSVEDEMKGLPQGEPDRSGDRFHWLSFPLTRLTHASAVDTDIPPLLTNL